MITSSSPLPAFPFQFLNSRSSNALNLHSPTTFHSAASGVVPESPTRRRDRQTDARRPPRRMDAADPLCSISSPARLLPRSLGPAAAAASPSKAREVLLEAISRARHLVRMLARPLRAQTSQMATSTPIPNPSLESPPCLLVEVEFQGLSRDLGLYFCFFIYSLGLIPLICFSFFSKLLEGNAGSNSSNKRFFFINWISMVLISMFRNVLCRQGPRIWLNRPEWY